MQILVVAATALEIAPFTAEHRKTDLLVTGVGVPSALYQLQKAVYEKKYDWVVQGGLAGSFRPDMDLAMSVAVSDDIFADLGMEENGKFTPIFQSGFMDKDEFPFSNGWLGNPHLDIFEALPKVRAVTINKVSDSMLQKNQLVDNFCPTIESMEGAALHYLCLQTHTRFVQVRSISNFVGERNKNNWKIKEAVASLNKSLGAIVDLLESN